MAPIRGLDLAASRTPRLTAVGTSRLMRLRWMVARNAATRCVLASPPRHTGRNRRTAVLRGSPRCRAGRHQQRRHGPYAMPRSVRRSDWPAGVLDALALFDGERIGDIVNRTARVDHRTDHRPVARGRGFADVRQPGRTDCKAWTLERYAPHPVAAMDQPVKLPSFWQQSWKAAVVWCRQAQILASLISVAPRRNSARHGTSWMRALSDADGAGGDGQADHAGMIAGRCKRSAPLRLYSSCC